MTIHEMIDVLKPWPSMPYWLAVCWFWLKYQLASVYSRVHGLPLDHFEQWLVEYAWATGQEDKIQPEFEGWLCNCGHWEDEPLHCSCCGAEPPWGCDCSFCDEARHAGDDEYLTLWEDYPGNLLVGDVAYGEWDEQDKCEENADV